MCNTTKTSTQQLNFINRLYGSLVKYSNNKNTSEPNLNSYIFVVRKSLCKDNNLFKSYTLTNYNDNDYEFTDEEREEYKNYIESMTKNIKTLCIKTEIEKLE